MKTLLNKQIVLGVTGGIAAYKSADLVRWADALLIAPCSADFIAQEQAWARLSMRRWSLPLVPAISLLSFTKA